MEPNNKKYIRIPFIATIIAILMMIGFGIGFGPIYILWTFVGAIAVIINFTFMLKIGIKNRNLLFFVIMIIIKMLVYGGIILLISFATDNDTKAFISVACGFSTLIVAIPTHFIIGAIRKEEF